MAYGLPWHSADFQGIGWLRFELLNQLRLYQVWGVACQYVFVAHAPVFIHR